MFRRHRVLILVVAAIVLFALWYAFRPEKLFINKRVDEPPPAIILVSAAHVPNSKPVHVHLPVI